MEKDIVCGMEVSPSTTYQSDYKDQHYFFCSGHCQHKFLEHPENFLLSESASCYNHSCSTDTDKSVLYTCPMHPEVEQIGPGSCPKCGMALEPKTVQLEDDTTEYDMMKRRFWISSVLSLFVLISAMGSEFFPEQFDMLIYPQSRQWFEMLLSAPVVWWGGSIFYVKAWESIQIGRAHV